MLLPTRAQLAVSPGPKGPFRSANLLMIFQLFAHPKLALIAAARGYQRLALSAAKRASGSPINPPTRGSLWFQRFVAHCPLSASF